MTRKDYILISTALYEARLDIDRCTRDSDEKNALRIGLNTAVVKLAERLGQDNPRFDTARFFNAAGLVSGDEPVPTY